MKPAFFRQSVSADRDAYSNLKASANPRASLNFFDDPGLNGESVRGLVPVALRKRRKD
jgi:hypothetical protein